MQVAPKCVPGPLAKGNAGAVDMSWQGLLAYGCHSAVVVVHPDSLEVVQSLDAVSDEPVSLLRWSSEPLSDSFDQPYYLKLAAVDALGAITVWNVADGLPMVRCPPARPLVDLLWLPAGHLLAIETSGRLVLYNTEAGTRVWAYGLPEPMNAAGLDPFHDTVLLLTAASGWVYCVTDWTLELPPASVVRKYRISDAAPAPADPLDRSMSDVEPGAVPQPASGSSRIAKFSSFINRLGSSGSPPSSSPLSSSPPLAGGVASRKDPHLAMPAQLAMNRRSRSLSPRTVASASAAAAATRVEPQGGGKLVDVVYSLSTPSIVYFVLQWEILLFDLVLEQALCAIQLDRKRYAPLTRIYVLRNDPSLLYALHADGLVVCRSTPPNAFEYSVVWASSALRKSSVSGGPLGHVYGAAMAPLSPQRMALVTSLGAVAILDLISPHNASPRLALTGTHEGLTRKLSVLAVAPDGLTAAVGSGDGLVQLVHLGSGEVERTWAVFDTAVMGLAWASSSCLVAYTRDGTPSWADPTKLVSSSGSAEFANALVALNIASGRALPLRTTVTGDAAPITSLAVAASGKLIALAFARPLHETLEIWDMKSDSLLRAVSGHGPIRALAWSPPNYDVSLTTLSAAESTLLAQAASNALVEQLVFATDAHILLRYTVVAGAVHPGASIALDVTEPVTALAWSSTLIVAGTLHGSVHVLDLAHNMLHESASLHGPVTSLAFAHPASPNWARLLVGFDGGGFGVWDALARVALNHSSRTSGLRLLASALSWAGENPVVLSLDGMLRVLDPTLSRASAHMSQRATTATTLSLISPLTLPHHVALSLKARLQHGLQPPELVAPPHISLVECNSDRIRSARDSLRASEANLPARLRAELLAASGPAQRALAAASFFGDQDGVEFWTVVEHYVQKAKQAQSGAEHAPRSQEAPAAYDLITSSASPPPSLPLEDSRHGGSLAATDSASAPSSASKASELLPLSAHHDLLQEREAVVDRDSRLLAMHTHKRGDHEFTLTKVHAHIQLGEYPAAVRMLLETPVDHPAYMVDSLKACLVSAVMSPHSFVSTVKLVATDLVSNGHVTEGVQLLCLIGKRADACRYMQSYGLWREAAWLAKIGLDEAAAAVVFSAWAEHLADAGDVDAAIGVLISLMDWHSALQLLYNRKAYSRAALLARTCVAEGLLVADGDPAATHPRGSAGRSLLPLRPLLEAIYLEYGMFLYHIGAMELAESYLLRAGPTGEHMLECLVQSIIRGP
ncbi:bromodomain and WD repeat-containing protein 2 [Thecamonas trahens ATCC 50062]|uniref:Bromodomain and WD repeat-containing protein 2 n=1 Tax=Thecamonas trahens ATCC 50062 TaxID=461836 RepID=A0A0L0DJI0_THETB|nr:bromodomain and WD repeat-containing protein 2 [Thecamonas trahens ATCC 50062]KNC52246.1 bromodomain and WD repeat-containing protein 2 [Thecamonas trahens ATCC 50062]|eukprot:XP_013762248.1 bromodomain and WD repeat-containing protein 2 [Thecamonas trahens ATCC 50062]